MMEHIMICEANKTKFWHLSASFVEQNTHALFNGNFALQSHKMQIGLAERVVHMLDSIEA